MRTTLNDFLKHLLLIECVLLAIFPLHIYIVESNKQCSIFQSYGKPGLFVLEEGKERKKCLRLFRLKNSFGFGFAVLINAEMVRVQRIVVRTEELLNLSKHTKDEAENRI